MNTASNTLSERQDIPPDIEALLPWHAVGTLNRADTLRVDKALAHDRELARRYEMVRDELGETISLNESLGAPSMRAMDKLFAAIDAEPAPLRQKVASFNLVEKVSDFFASLSPRTLAFSASAAALVLLLQGAVITGVLLSKPEANQSFSVASADPMPQVEQAIYSLVQFKPTATAADITTFLKDTNASIVSGPSRTEMYKVKVAVTGMPKEELAKLIKKIEEDKSVAASFPSSSK
ncbi:MAG: hypothetical protein JWN71_4246 [Xanthobacteraceae bacterium]|jgi:negative regulator of sigma E activity|nr:hypothetical protein [Xanthobacteraceae bacterium]